MKGLKTILGAVLATTCMGGAIAFAVGSSQETFSKTEAASVSKTRIVLELEDQCYSTDSGRDPTLRIWNISVDSSMDYDSNNVSDELKASQSINDFETGATKRVINDDGSIDTGLTWIKQEGSKRYWKVQLPWYITGFTFKLYCGSYWAGGENTVTKRGSHMIYNYGSWNSWNTSLTQDTSSQSNTYSVTNYAITAASSGGVSDDGHTAQVKGNGGSYVSSGNYFPRQKISLKATNGTYSSFNSWNYGKSVSSATTYDYVGTATKTYTATFADTRQSYTVVFKDEDGTTLETKNNVYQGSSVTPTSIPTKADEEGIHYTFDCWRDAQGNDKTAALANIQSDLTVFASYTSSYKTGRYAIGDFGDCSWGVENAIWLPNTGTQYEGQISLEYGDVFKIAYYNGTSLESYFGYSSILESCGAFHYFSSGENSNIVCYARGTYNLYFTDGEYASGKKISIELSSSLNAEHLAAKLMGFGEWEGHCGDNDRFPAMKAIFLNLDPSEQSTFQSYSLSSVDQFKNAYLRYVAWAAALGEKPWESGKVKGSFRISLATNNSTGSVVIVVICLVLFSSAGGYFFLRKKKHQ